MAYQPNQDSLFILCTALSHHFQFLRMVWVFFDLCNEGENSIVYAFIGLA